MKYSVGYQTFSDDSFVDEFVKYKDSISEIFSWGDFPNVRNSQSIAFLKKCETVGLLRSN